MKGVPLAFPGSEYTALGSKMEMPLPWEMPCPSRHPRRAVPKPLAVV